jgi:hypothetical protein
VEAGAVFSEQAKELSSISCNDRFGSYGAGSVPTDPMFSPASVSAFLEEAVRSLPLSPGAGERVLKDILRETCESPTLDVVRAEAAKLFPSPLGRSPILALIAHPETCGSLKDDELRRIIGVSLDVQISDPQWASWLFRDLQAGRSTKEQPKKRASKGTA